MEHWRNNFQQTIPIKATFFCSHAEFCISSFVPSLNRIMICEQWESSQKTTSLFAVVFVRTCTHCFRLICTTMRWERSSISRSRSFPHCHRLLLLDHTKNVVLFPPNKAGDDNVDGGLGFEKFEAIWRNFDQFSIIMFPRFPPGRGGRTSRIAEKWHGGFHISLPANNATKSSWFCWFRLLTQQWGEKNALLLIVGYNHQLFCGVIHSSAYAKRRRVRVRTYS